MLTYMCSTATISFLGRGFSLYKASTVTDITAYALKYMHTGRDEETIRRAALKAVTKYLERYKEHWPTIYGRQDMTDAANEVAELVTTLGTKGAVAEAVKRRKAAAAAATAEAAVASEHDAQCDDHDQEGAGMGSDDDSSSTSDQSSNTSDHSSSSSDISNGLEEKVPLLIV